MAEHTLVVEAAQDGMRLDRFLTERLDGLGRAGARALVDGGGVRVDGRFRKRGERVRAGETVTVASAPPRSDFAAAPDPDLALPVLFEDAHLVVVDKPPGVPSHPLAPGEVGTVASSLVARFPEMASVGYSPREPGIVHRLDTDTSGLLLAARTPAAFEALRDALRAGRIDKRYVAACAGRAPGPRLLDWPIANHPKDKRRVVACLDSIEMGRLRARPAETEVLEVRHVGERSRVQVRARSARRHQVRAHLAAWGYPLLGDPLYGGPETPGLARHALHASALGLVHPITGEDVVIAAPLPADLAALL